MYESDVERVFGEIGQFPRPQLPDEAKTRVERIEEWLTLGFVIDAYESIQSGGIEMALNYDNKENPAYKLVNSRLVRGVRRVGFVFAAGVAVYDGYEMSHDSDFAHLGRNWVENGLLRSAIVIVRAGVTLGAGAASTAACGP